jgi:riboflavin synthase
MERRGGDVSMRVVSRALPWADYAVGESIAVNGVCLTIVNLHEDGFDADVSVETLEVTTLGETGERGRVNLEPALSVGERLGGHLVSGHVDCKGRIIELTSDARSIRMRVELPTEYARYVAQKGSICIDGVSLTINAVSGSCFELNIIPHTADNTIIGDYAVGSVVNIEVDLLARYLERLLRKDGDGITEDFLRVHGYA